MRVVECKRVVLGRQSVSQAALKRRIQEHEGLPSRGLYFHSVLRRNGICWLVSGDAEGVPLVESVIGYLKVNKPLAIFYRKENGNGTLYLGLVLGEHQEQITEIKIDSVTEPMVGKIIGEVAGKNGLIVNVDDAILNDEIDGRPVNKVDLSSHQDKKELTLKQGYKHQVPLTIQQKAIIVFAACFVLLVLVFMFKGEQEKAEQKKETVSYSDLKSQVETRGSAKALTWQMYRDFNFIRSLNGYGWEAKGINVNQETAFIEVAKMSTGRIEDLISLANRTGRQVVSYDTNKATVLSTYNAFPALGEVILPPFEDLKLYISLAQQDWLGEENTRSVQFSTLVKKKGYSVGDLSWQFENYYSDDIDVLGTILHMLPITFESAALVVNSNGTYSGKMAFKVYTCERKNIVNNKYCK